ncbi:MAG TPA: hypothetical protein VFI47_22800 [Acidimicrobiales bacterium]|nr:hypothetical protein [Acidimicrobiales bacterium]
MSGYDAGWGPDPGGRGDDHDHWHGGAPGAAAPPDRPARRPAARVAAALLGVAVLGVGAGAVAGLAAPGGDGLEDALASDLETRAQGLLTAAEADCTAARMMVDLGEDRVRDLGLVGAPEAPWPLDELTDVERRAFASASFGCVEAGHLGPLLGEQWAPADAKTTEQRTCVAEGYAQALSPARLRKILVALYVHDTYDVDEVLTEPERQAVRNVREGCA